MEPAEGKNKSVIVIILILIALVLVGYGFYRSRAPKIPSAPIENETTEEPRDQYAEIVNAKHQYKGGKHTYVGELNLGTPCELLKFDVIKDSLNPRSIEINFQSFYDGSEGCIQVITPRPFKVAFEAPQSVNLTVTFNGKPIRFNLFEVPANEDLDSFDINVKG